tara:strand:- start:254 stop:2110 length:1857 start_codon:yes stop_codon:yes gene_type:complete
MAKLTINLGTNPNDGTGDNLRGGGTKINANFNELYSAIGDGTTLSGFIKLSDSTSTVSQIDLGETLKITGGAGIDATLSGDELTIATDNTIMTSSGTVTMSNKSMALSSNTLTGTTAEFNTALTDDDFATLTNSVSLTNKSISGSANTLTNVPNSALVNPKFTLVDTSSTSTDINLGETLKIVGSGGATSTVSGDTVTIAVSNLTNTNLSGSAGITNANLANSAVTLGATSVSLGATAASASNFSLTGASSVSGTGTIDLTGAGSKARFNFAGTAAFPSETSYEGMFAYDTTGDKPYVADAAGWINILTENDGVERHPNVNISGIANGNTLVWNSAQARFNAGSASGALTVQEEGSALSTDATTLNFVGSAVTASGTGATKTITITGGDVVSDTTPQLGGFLDAQNNHITDIAYSGFRSTSQVDRVITVTVATKDTTHFKYNTGSNNGYVLDGVQSPELILAPGIYKFDQSDPSNATHPLAFYWDIDKDRQWTTNVTTSGTPGNAGAYTRIDVHSQTPRTLSYQCTAHSYMGHKVNCLGGKVNRVINSHQKFTGNLAGANSGKSFTGLTYGGTVDDMLVFVNGVCMVPTDDYTVSGQTLTFQVAPADNAEITVRHIGY